MGGDLHHEQFYDHSTKQGSSWIWQGISNCKDLVSKGACFSIGDGLGINIWKESWVPWLENYRPTNLDTCSRPYLRWGGNSRNRTILGATFVQDSVDAILKVWIPPNREEISYFGFPIAKGSFSVKQLT